MNFRLEWYRYHCGYMAPHVLHVEATVPGRSPTVITTVRLFPLVGGGWEIVAGELLPLKFSGDEKAAKRRGLHLVLQLLNGAINCVSDELAKES